MSRYIATRAIRGANALVHEAEVMLQRALKEKKPTTPVAFPNTAYYLPLIYGMTGQKVETLADLQPALAHAHELLHPLPSAQNWTPYLGETLDSGMATLIAAEVIEAIRFVYGAQPELLPGFHLSGGTAFTSPDNGKGKFTNGDGYLNGPIDDIQLRSWGIQLVDGRMPGFAAIVGCAKSNEVAVKLVRELQRRNILTFLSGNVNGRSIIHQLHEEGVELGYDTYTVPFGTDTLSAIYALGFATRSALTFGGLKAGQARDILLYNKERVFAFVLALGEVDDLKYAAAAGAINFGFPVIADTVIPEILPTGITTYEHVVSMPFNEIPGVNDLERAERLVQKCIEIRGVKIKMTNVPVPVPYGSAFEGEVVRKADMRVEFGGQHSRCFEFLTMADLNALTDGKIEIVGPDFSQIPAKGAMDLGIVVQVAGREMQKDFEPVLERQIHYFVNGASGVQHIGQRDIAWIRLSQTAVDKGYDLTHFGKILHARFHADFGAIVDKVQVTLYTDPAALAEWLERAREAYNFRNQRLADLTDTAVNEFYSCTLCQSFAPDHVCIVSPERLGLCGAYNWLDCKASFSINPTGPNQPIKLGKLLDPEVGYWSGTIDYARQGSHGAVQNVSMYSIMENPMTACLLPETEVLVDGASRPLGELVDLPPDTATSTVLSAGVTTLDQGHTATSRLLHVHKNPAPSRLIQLETKSGQTLTLTPNHEVAVDRWGQNGDGPWVRADEVQPGDRLYALKNWRLEGRVPLVIDLLPDDCRIADAAWLEGLYQLLPKRFGSLAAAFRQVGAAPPDPRVASLPIGVAKKLVQLLDESWDAWRIPVTQAAPPSGSPVMPLPTLTPDLLYLLGLLASDGSLSWHGRYQCRVNFTNTNPELLTAFSEIYRQHFPSATLSQRQKSGGGQVQGRQISSQQPATDLYGNNFLFGLLAEGLGVRRRQPPVWDLTRLASLPEAHIAAFLGGVCDGDGSVRLRLHEGQWPTGEAYLSHQNEHAARHLQLLLKRLGIVSQVRRETAVYKVEMHGRNLRRFAQQVTLRHPQKQAALAQIAQLDSDVVDKTQEQVLPYRVGQLLAELPASQAILSPSTLFYYKTGRSRPVADNVRRVMTEAPETTAVLAPLLEVDYFLDTVTAVTPIENEGQFTHVYNLSLLDINSYFANGVLVKNCGCFECIVMYIPEVEGVMVVSREDVGMTPAGMKFSTLAGMAGGGVQTPGVMGVGKYYLVSPKFISADGGFKRVVWLSKVIKETMADELQHVAEREGIPDLIDRIADGDKINTVEQLQDWVEEVHHPVLDLGPMGREPAELPEPDEELMAQATAVVEAAMADLSAKDAKSAKEEEVEEVSFRAESAERGIPPEQLETGGSSEDVSAASAQALGMTVAYQETKEVKLEEIPKSVPSVESVDAPQTQAELLQQAQAAALRQAQALQQAASEALRQAELLGQVREMAAQPATPAEAVESLRQALMAALGALGGAVPATAVAPPPTHEPVKQALPPVEEVPIIAKAPEPKPEIRSSKPEVQPPITDKPWLPPTTKTPLAKEKWAGKVREVTLGATKAQGGTRAKTVTVGGETAMPFLDFEGVMPHPPVIAVEVHDRKPEDWSPLLLEAWGDVVADPVRWAQTAEKAGAGLIQLSLGLENGVDTAVATVRSVLQATGLPLIVVGPGQAEKDNALLVPIADVFKGERLALGICEDKNYRTIVASAMANDHLVIARTAMDVNLAKQLNILISDMGLPLDRVIMDPTTGALGYGFEYGYSVMERLRLAALQGDGMTQLPMMVTPGEEAWKTKEAKVGVGVPAAWGDWAERAITWETVTAVMLIESGANILTLRHPEAVRRVQAAINDLVKAA